MIFFLGEVQCHGAVYLKNCCIFLFYHKFYYTRRINITLINSLILLDLLFAAMISGKCQIRHMFVQVLPCCSLPVPFSTWPRYTSYLRYISYLIRPYLRWIVIIKGQQDVYFVWLDQSSYSEKMSENSPAPLSWKLDRFPCFTYRQTTVM